jgi:N-acetyl-alpha-D-glucosaminyl L-malate synthase BshA
MKIGVLCYPTHGGSGVVASELSIGLVERGHEVHIVSYATPFRLQGFHPNMFVHEVGFATYPLLKYPPYALALATKLVDLAESFHIELIHAHYAMPHATSAYLAKQIMKSQGIKTVTTLHGTDITLVGADASFQKVIKFAIEESDGVTAVSRYLKQRTIEEFGIQREIRVINNFIDPGRPARSRNVSLRETYAPNGEKILMHASNFRPVKRTDDVIRVFARVQELIPSRLILIGEGPEIRKTQQLVSDLNLSDRVHFLGEQDQLEPLFSCADLFLLPSEQESFGLTALEAMNCGVPVIATDIGGLPELITHGETGYMFPIGETEKMAAAAAALLLDHEQHQRFGRKARDRAVQGFNASQIIPQYEAFYEEVLQS